MRDSTHDLRVSARTAGLTAGTDDTGGPPYRFGGVAVAAGDILHTDDGTRVLFTAEELQAAAETQAGEPLTKDHPEDESGRPKYPPDVDETFGTVPKAGWVDSQQAVGYEATTHDESVAAGVRGGSFDVSVHPFFDTEPYDGPEADVIATNIKFGDLSVVSKGDSPSNTAEWGPNQALASWTASADFGADLSDEASLTAGADGDHQGLISSTVRGTLQAIGITPAEPGQETDSQPTTGAESPADPSSETQDTNTNMDESTRQQYVAFLTEESGFDEESLTAMDDDVLERTHSLAAEAADADGGSTETDDDDDPDDTGDTTLADMTLDDLAEGLKQQGFVTEDNAGDLVEQAQAQASKAEKVDEIIASSDEFDTEDRESLLASSDKMLDREFQRVRGAGAASLPGSAGAMTGLTAGASSPGADDYDAYGTGVQGEGQSQGGDDE